MSVLRELNFIDVGCFAVIFIFALYGYSKGIMKFVFRLAATVVAAVGARIASVPLTDFLYDGFLKDKIAVQLYKLLPSGSVSGGINALIGTIKDALPDAAVRIAEFLNIFPKGGDVVTGELLSVAQIENDYIRPIVTKVVLIITTLAVFMIVAVILNMAVKMINKKFFEEKKGVISTVNRILGSLFGIVRGMVPIAFFAALMLLLAPVVGNEKLNDAVETSFVCSLIAQIF